MINIGFRFFFLGFILSAGVLGSNTLFAAASAASTATTKPNSTIASEPLPLDSESSDDKTVASTAIDFNNPPPVTQADPLEKFNRPMFKFNEFFDDYFLKPTSELYSKIVPKPLAKGIGNVYSNIDMIPTVLNDLLMGNFYQATSDVWRFGVNTTVGIGGLFDVASHVGLEPNAEDFGLTLAQWGWTNSSYLVLPFMGPLTVRDGLVGYPVNYYALSIYPYIHPADLQFGIYALGVVSRRAELLHYQEVMDTVAIDKYVFMRDAYLQRRNYLIQRNKELNNPYTARSDLESSASAKKEQQVQEQTRPFSSI